MPLPMIIQNPFCSRCHVSGSSWDNAERCETADLDKSFQVHVACRFSPQAVCKACVRELIGNLHPQNDLIGKFCADTFFDRAVLYGKSLEILELPLNCVLSPCFCQGICEFSHDIQDLQPRLG